METELSYIRTVCSRVINVRISILRLILFLFLLEAIDPCQDLIADPSRDNTVFANDLLVNVTISGLKCSL